VKVPVTVDSATSGVVTVVAEERVDRLMVVLPRSTRTEELDVGVDEAERVVVNVLPPLVMVDVVALGLLALWEDVCWLGVEFSGVEVVCPAGVLVGVLFALELVVCCCADELTELVSVLPPAVEVRPPTSEVGRLTDTLMPVATWRLNMMPDGMRSAGTWAKPKMSASMIDEEDVGDVVVTKTDARAMNRMRRLGGAKGDCGSRPLDDRRVD